MALQLKSRDRSNVQLPETKTVNFAAFDIHQIGVLLLLSLEAVLLSTFSYYYFAVTDVFPVKLINDDGN